ncbi:MAG: hypothetical protein M3419_12540 [Actinomycetota bacterium]|nr:hypothetical protein [Actinomycetota bacterium]
MLFSVDARPGLADGSITMTVRRWKRAQVKPGGAHRVLGLRLVVHTVQQVTAADLTSADARACGEADLPALLRRVGGGTQPPGATQVWQVTFSVTGPDDRIELGDRRAEGAELDTVQASLARLDRAASSGPWTRTVLQLIAEQPGVVSTELAAQLGRDRWEFKRDVRKLKERGLTRSLPIGYELSPRGRSVLDSLK